MLFPLCSLDPKHCFFFSSQPPSLIQLDRGKVGSKISHSVAKVMVCDMTFALTWEKSQRTWIFLKWLPRMNLKQRALWVSELLTQCCVPIKGLMGDRFPVRLSTFTDEVIVLCLRCLTDWSAHLTCERNNLGRRPYSPFLVGSWKDQYCSRIGPNHDRSINL